MQTIILIIQLANAGFVGWGGWLCLSARVREMRGERALHPDNAAASPSGDSFERVASLVLLALLCTTIAALA